MKHVRRAVLLVAIALVAIGLTVALGAAVALAAQPTSPAAVTTPPTLPELQAGVVRLQSQVLERDREIGLLRARIAELELAALKEAAVRLEPAVRKLLGIADPVTPPATPPGKDPK